MLSASGTAAIIGFQYSGEAGDSVGSLPVIPKSNTTGKDILTTSLDRSDFEKEKVTAKNSECTAVSFFFKQKTSKTSSYVILGKFQNAA